jgi:hypothetical protein
MTAVAPSMPGAYSPGTGARNIAGAAVKYRPGDFLSEDRRGRTGRVREVHGPEPFLYGIQLVSGHFGYAYEEDLRPASKAEIVAYAQMSRCTPEPLEARPFDGAGA